MYLKKSCGFLPPIAGILMRHCASEIQPAIFVHKPIRFNVHLFTQSSMEAGRAELWYIEGRQVSIRHFFVKACCSDFSRYRFGGKGVKIQEHFQRLGIYVPRAERKLGQMTSLFNRDQR
jgi:hypothetical protein